MFTTEKEHHVSKIVHTTSGDEPITIRSLVEIAEREGWDLDTRLAFFDPSLEDEQIVRGAARVPGVFGDGDLRIDLDLVPEQDWEVVAGTLSTEEVADRIAERVLDDMGHELHEPDPDNVLLVNGVAMILDVLSRSWGEEDGGDHEDVEGLKDWLFNMGPHEINDDRCLAAAQQYRDSMRNSD